MMLGRRGLSLWRQASGRTVAFQTARTLSVSAEESFLSGTNSVYMEQMHAQWSVDPSSVHVSWASYFENLEAGVPPSQAFTLSPALQVGQARAAAIASTGGDNGDSTRMLHMVYAFQANGHKMASLDPLNLSVKENVPELDPSFYGLSDSDMDRALNLDAFGLDKLEGVMKNADTNNDGVTTMRELHEFLKRVYTGKVGYEYSHLQNQEKKNFIRARIEVNQTEHTKEHTLKILERLAKADKFERFLAMKFNTAKRFGLEGCDSMIPGIMELVDTCVGQGVREVVIGMPHRGRLNVLTNVVNKPMEIIVQEFQGVSMKDDDWSGSGDVKYHLGTSTTSVGPNGESVHISLVPNPSHLETVNPVAVGKARAKMDALDDKAGDQVLPILIHGDAAFAGQGVVYETMQMAKLRHYSSGGTVHVICNNQVGFTCDPSDSRSTRYSSDLGKGFECPTFHVNADDPDEVCRVFKLAADYRSKFKADVLIDLIGYRKYGHNELDQPAYTQPHMYEVIQKMPSCLEIFTSTLVNSGRVQQAEVEEVTGAVQKKVSEAFENAASFSYNQSKTWLDKNWSAMCKPGDKNIPVMPHFATTELLDTVGPRITALPEGFTVHKSLKRTLKQRADSIASGKLLDWGSAEMLAFGTLLAEGYNVRLSGQDCERGTFSHRHCVVHDQKNASKHEFLKHMDLAGMGSFSTANSFLSEYGAMGFELGYSMESPNNLVLWEAQFGDFVNGAQIIIDQYLAAMESKWLRQTGLVLLLPHGYQGMGPEHSSARIERFLQQTDEDPDEVPASFVGGNVTAEDRQVQLSQCNWQVVNPTTPAQYFHCLRRQIHRPFRKPLIVASTKSLLRHKVAVSNIEDFAEGTKFERIIPEWKPEELVAPAEVKRLVLCSGKIYYELLDQRQREGVDNVAIVRVEQLSPFPFDHIQAQAAKYPGAEIVWAQEEPKNQGAWTYVKHRLPVAMAEQGCGREAQYVGRRTMASTAEGYNASHEREQKRIVTTALTL